MFMKLTFLKMFIRCFQYCFPDELLFNRHLGDMCYLGLAKFHLSTMFHYEKYNLFLIYNISQRNLT